MQIAVVADIHGNLFALERVLEDIRNLNVSKIALLGDLIDYGMQSNEVIECLKGADDLDVVCNIWGNHERAIMLGDFTRFSSPRGEVSARHTADMLTDGSRTYLDSELVHEGICEFELDGLRCLAVHGSLDDNYWKAISPDDLRGDYSGYDLVLSAHSHYSHFFTKFYEADDPKMRNKHRVAFVNPGSVGQPRNHNRNAQYAVIDTDTGCVMMRSVEYPVELAMELFDGSVDDFYRSRLDTGV